MKNTCEVPEGMNPKQAEELLKVIKMCSEVTIHRNWNYYAQYPDWDWSISKAVVRNLEEAEHFFSLITFSGRPESLCHLIERAREKFIRWPDFPQDYPKNPGGKK